jgi:hypothetical protein
MLEEKSWPILGYYHGIHQQQMRKTMTKLSQVSYSLVKIQTQYLGFITTVVTCSEQTKTQPISNKTGK